MAEMIAVKSEKGLFIEKNGKKIGLFNKKIKEGMITVYDNGSGQFSNASYKESLTKKVVDELIKAFEVKKPSSGK